jgi:MoaA/NifB/PqqE/SkfB family radical SAM enzyme
MSQGERIDPFISSMAVHKVAKEYGIRTVLAFGGEPLLHTDATFAIMNSAKQMDIPHRQVITNGYFSREELRIHEVARGLRESGVNDLLLSVDSFHQETIPVDVVRKFALAVKKFEVPIRLQPAWLVGSEHDNPYNRRTREILDSFSDLDIPVGEGNVIFPEGNALKYLGEYFTDNAPKNPYIEDPCDVKCISFEPNGNVLDGNIYRNDVMEIIEKYTPLMNRQENRHEKNT